ncbi:MAG TPA: DinB family protein [Terriglobales bacterium]|nr:DinB family protein [Terriglobales bacterium]
MNPYASYLGSQDAIEVLSATSTRLKDIAVALGEERVEQAPAPGKWSPREVFIHLADCEIAFGFRYRQTLAEDNHTVQPFDQDKWAKPYAAYSAEQALSTFTMLRKWNLSLLRSLTAEQLDKSVMHPERGQETLRNLIAISAGHDLNHLQRLQAIASKPAA